MITSVNNILYPEFQRMLTFNGKPTIVRVDENQYSFLDEPEQLMGKKAKAELIVFSGSYDAGTTYFISINGHQVTSVADYKQASSTNFVTNTMLGVNYSRAMAYSIADALTASPLGATYNVWVDDDTYKNTGQKVIVEAKQMGAKYNITSILNNFPSGYLQYTTEDGYTEETTLDNSKVILEIFAETNSDNQATVNDMNTTVPTQFITRLEKNATIGGVSFDISSVLDALTLDNKVTTYAIRTSYTKKGNHSKIGTKTGLMAINGYAVNQCDDYKLLNANDIVLLQHVERGSDKGYTNNTMLYCYNNQEMTVSVLTPNANHIVWSVKKLNSAKEIMSTSTYSTTPVGSIATIKYTPTQLDDTHYILMTIGDKYNLLYKVIQPVAYADETNVQTLYWNNEYGGISFMPFTGKRTDEREAEKATFKPQSFNYYRNTRKESEQVFKTNTNYTVTLKTHYIENDGKYLLFSLNNAKRVWTVINNIEYAVIVDDIELTEIQRNIYEVTVKYHYSADNLV